MGVNVGVLQFLLHAKSRGVDFSRTAMIGRQRLSVTFEQFCHVLRAVDKTIGTEQLRNLYEDRYAEPLLKYLGAKEIHSFDYSDYEQATHVHDFNYPIAGEFRNRYTVVWNSGTLEHIFDFPRAIRSCMEMVAVGGRFLDASPTNNQLGHGFYQFSPELYFRLFAEANGYRIDDMFLYERGPSKMIPRKTVWFRVVDPLKAQRRGNFPSNTAVFLFTIAAKIAYCELLATPPLQSHFASMWQSGKNMNAEREPFLYRVRRKLKRQWRKHVRRQRFDAALYEPFEPFPS